jgi:exonuclease III
MTRLRIASINIERSKHLHRVEAFLKTYKPDVLCLQELMERDIPFFEDLMGNTLHYAPMCLHPQENLQVQGVGLVSWAALEDVQTTYYHGSIDHGLEAELEYGANKVPNALLAGAYQGFRISTTHLNVTQHGISTPGQLASAAKLIDVAKAQAEVHGGLLMCGDFNAPRGRPTFSRIAEAFEDGVPQEYTSSIDGSLHRAGPLPLMVDGLFHTPSYTLQDAKMHTGISDHCALTCTLSKAILINY